MSGSTGATTADRQRQRSARGAAKAAGNRMPAPPRQRRSALAAIAVLLIVGGALVAGLLAIRMDSRVGVLAARNTIAPGSEITAEDLTTVQVASEGISLIGAQYEKEIIGTYAKGTIYQGMLVDTNMITEKSPVGSGRVIVSVQLVPALTPERELARGDLVQVVRASGNTSTGSDAEDAEDVTQGLVISVSRPKEDSLGGASSGSVSLLVPEEDAKDVIDASHATLAGLALVSRGNQISVIPES